MPQIWIRRFATLCVLAWIALAGIILLIASLFVRDEFRVVPAVFGVVLFLPAFLYLYVITIWHWKDRYEGRHSDLWGALLLIETSGWFKVVYVFRHIIPDMRRTGRYRLLQTTDPDPLIPTLK